MKMGLDIKKISVATWLILGGIFLYTASLWQRPLFISEFADNCGAISVLQEGMAGSFRDVFFSFIFKHFGFSPFIFRLPGALLVLLSGAAILYSGRSSRFTNVSTAGALIFLLTPAIFLSGTCAHASVFYGAPSVLCFYLLCLASGSRSLKQAFLTGVPAAAAALLLQFFGGSFHLFFLAVTWLLYGVVSQLVNVPREEKQKISHFLWTFIPLIPAACCIPLTGVQTLFRLPGVPELKTLCACIAAGSFPWVIFLPAALKNLFARLAKICSDPFALASLVLCGTSLTAALFTPLQGGFFIPFLAGAAVVLAAGMEMEHEENGSRSANIVLYILAVIFFLTAAALCAWGALGLYTKLLKPAWKLFNAKDAWGLTALVPAVTAIWALTSAGEKTVKERKFLYLCAGIAFVLVAFHGLVPLKAVENNAPANFLQKVVKPKTGPRVTFYGDREMYAPLVSVFRDSAIKQLGRNNDIAVIKARAKAGEKMCVVTLSRSLSNRLPFPKTTLRSGRFSAVFYNIDFPEMRVRKP